MNVIYSLRETLNGIKNTRLSHTISIFIISFLLLILSVAFIASININRITDILNAERDIQAFLANTLDEQEAMAAYHKVMEMPGVQYVEYISKEMAAIEFEQEFGENIIAVLGENPLPAILKITLVAEQVNSPSLSTIAETLQEMSEIDEIVSEQSSFAQLVYFARLSKRVLWFIFALVAIASLFIVSNTTRLIIANRRHIIDTMKLVGATHAFIRFPYVLQGAIQGLLGGILTFFILNVLLAIINTYWPSVIVVSHSQLLLVIFVGFILGLGGSVFSIRKFLSL